MGTQKIVLLSQSVNGRMRTCDRGPDGEGPQQQQSSWEYAFSSTEAPHEADFPLMGAPTV